MRQGKTKARVGDVVIMHQHHHRSVRNGYMVDDEHDTHSLGQVTSVKPGGVIKNVRSFGYAGNNNQQGYDFGRSPFEDKPTITVLDQTNLDQVGLGKESINPNTNRDLEGLKKTVDKHRTGFTRSTRDTKSGPLHEKIGVSDPRDVTMYPEAAQNLDKHNLKIGDVVKHTGNRSGTKNGTWKIEALARSGNVRVRDQEFHSTVEMHPSEMRKVGGSGKAERGGAFKRGDEVEHTATGHRGVVTHVERSGKAWVQYPGGFGAVRRGEAHRIHEKHELALIETKESVHLRRGETINLNQAVRAQAAEKRKRELEKSKVSVNLPGGTRKRKRPSEPAPSRHVVAQELEKPSPVREPGERRVRTQAGAERYGVPIGTPITREMREEVSGGWKRGARHMADEAAKPKVPTTPVTGRSAPEPMPPTRSQRIDSSFHGMPALGTGRYTGNGGFGFGAGYGDTPTESIPKRVTAERGVNGNVIIRQHMNTGMVLMTQHPHSASALEQLNAIFRNHPHVPRTALVQLGDPNAAPPRRRFSLARRVVPRG